LGAGFGGPFSLFPYFIVKKQVEAVGWSVLRRTSMDNRSSVFVIHPFDTHEAAKGDEYSCIRRCHVQHVNKEALTPSSSGLRRDVVQSSVRHCAKGHKTLPADGASLNPSSNSWPDSPGRKDAVCLDEPSDILFPSATKKHQTPRQSSTRYFHLALPYSTPASVRPLHIYGIDFLTVSLPPSLFPHSTLDHRPERVTSETPAVREVRERSAPRKSGKQATTEKFLIARHTPQAKPAQRATLLDCCVAGQDVLVQTV
jgi:hypothetical protein